MRIRKGSQMEVWIQEVASPVGAWRSGEVQCGNSHSYILRWHDGGPDSGRISRKSVRPHPSPAPVTPDLDAGDMVEVFDEEDSLCKCAEVECDGGRQFRVKVVGAPMVLTVAPSLLRLRQILRDDDVTIQSLTPSRGSLPQDNQVLGASATPLHANGNGCGGGKPVAQGFGGGHAKLVASSINPLKLKRSPSVLDADAMDNDLLQSFREKDHRDDVAVSDI